MKATYENVIPKKRVNTFINADLCDKLDAYAKRIGLDRTNCINLILTTYFNQLENAEMISKFMDFVASDTGKNVLDAYVEQFKNEPLKKG